MGVRHRVVALWLTAGALLTLSACTGSGEIDGMPAHSTPAVAPVVVSTPSSTPPATFPPAPGPARSASAAARRTAFGNGCGTRTRTPETRYQATIGDVDGDGRRDVEWATIPEGGYIEFGVTTASGTTVARTVGFASGGQRVVSIGTLATGQTVALPTDQHGALLYVIHDCKWVEPEFTAKTGGTDFITGYYDPPGDGGGCIGRRLYQVEYTQPSKDHVTVTGITEHISADARRVTAGRQVTLLEDEDVDTSWKAIQSYGAGNCLPSPRLAPSDRRP